MRIKATVDIVSDDDLRFLYTPQAFITDWIDIDGFGDPELDSLKKGDSVEIVCTYVGDHKEPSDVGPRGHHDDFVFEFHGIELHKVD